MKLNRIILVLIMLNLTVIVSASVYYTVSASGARLDFVGEPTYECYKATNKGYYYNINIKIKNSASVKSCPIDIRIFENGVRSATNTSSCSGAVFGANEEKSFIIEWITPYPEKEIEIKYNPSNLDNGTKYNTGSKTINVIYQENKKENTPGFSFIVLVFSIIVFVFIKKKIKDNFLLYFNCR